MQNLQERTTALNCRASTPFKNSRPSAIPKELQETKGVELLSKPYLLYNMSEHVEVGELQTRVCELRVALETQTLRAAKSEEKVINFSSLAMQKAIRCCRSRWKSTRILGLQCTSQPVLCFASCLGGFIVDTNGRNLNQLLNSFDLTASHQATLTSKLYLLTGRPFE